MLEFGVSRACSKLSQKPAYFLPLTLCLLIYRFLLATVSLVFAPDCLFWHVTDLGAGERCLSDPQPKVRSCMVASGFLRYRPLSCGEALTFGPE